MLVLDAPGFDHHRVGGRFLIFPRFWGCTRPVSVVVTLGSGRPREGVSPLDDWGVRVLVLDAPGCIWKNEIKILSHFGRLQWILVLPFFSFLTYTMAARERLPFSLNVS